MQLGEEGAIQVFRPLRNTMMLLGAVGSLQFDVAAHRLAARIRRGSPHVAGALHLRALGVGGRSGRISRNSWKPMPAAWPSDAADALAVLTNTKFEMKVVQDRLPEIRFHAQREHAGLMADRIADLA